tara:strand:+ start:1573 stop:2643 length:1071 start_codon:yes stop_codon:yes gene_type:complete
MCSLTIGLTLYNKSQYINSLNNLLEIQNLSDDFEILIIDDCSTDNSLKLAEEILGNHAKFIALDKNQGVSNARNKIIQFAKKDFITFMDADDLINIKELVSIMNKIKLQEKNNPDIYIFPYSNFEKNGNFIKQVGTSDNKILSKKEVAMKILNYLLLPNLNGDFITCFSKIYRTNFLKNNQVFFSEDLKNFEDVDFIAKALYHNPLIQISNQEFYSHLDHPPGLSEKCSKTRSLMSHCGYINSTETMIKAYLNILGENEKNDDNIKKIYYSKAQAISIYTCIIIVQNCSKIKGFKSFLNYCKEVKVLLNDPNVVESFKLYSWKAANGSRFLTYFIRKKFSCLSTFYSFYKYKKRYR